ncbi:SID1 transmembrane family member 1-like [Tigriopus californicus]|uniref:SID1 transmembrane family member 1-like n=1 Tax=Tigriopus californicus TaxID=6832 RepID=UPI0027D9FB24|nr:SID1 transmembrane family member 1-like [Tigriopus californicus]|eukprot:TCALIF_00719-PA protein Name:"Similar to SIDT1 SID1 transmembrane family member 1 (Homo sapiens)" AED:0.03 eAED:0.03 QI:0/1/0/1/1/1/2/0/808
MLLLKFVIGCLLTHVWVWLGHAQNSEMIWYKYGAVTRQRQVTIISAKVGTEYNNQSSHDSEAHFVYRLDLGNFPPRTVRIRAEVRPNISPDHPLRVTIRSNQGTTNWNVPLLVNSVKINYMERTLCLLDDVISSPDRQEITVVVSTSSRNKVDFTLKLFEVEDFTTDMNQVSSLTGVDTATPVYRFVNLQPFEKTALLRVKVTSEDQDVCALISIQPYLCPVLDMERTVRFRGSYQSMLEISSFIIDPDEYEHGVFIVFIIPETDELCGISQSKSSIRKKSFSFEISNQISEIKIAWEVILSVVLLVVLCAVAIIGSCLCSVYGDRNIQNKIIKMKKFQRLYQGTYRVTTTEFPDECEITSSNEATDAPASSQNIIKDQTDIEQIENGKSKPRPKYVHELATTAKDREQLKLFKRMFQRSDLYLWLVLMMGIFYTIPAIQLMLSYQDKLLTSGDQDICYYNFLCSVPVGVVRDFNHIFSNIWYMALGILFVILSAYRKSVHLKFITELAKVDPAEVSSEYGIPQHFGILFAMGYAMVFEGILSACYHVCPTSENFQFDTTFMYVIATLSFMKIYQFRHPDIASNAYKVFFGLGLIMFFEVMGIFFGTTLFWILALVTYFGLSLVLTSIIYHSGRWSLDWKIFPKLARASYKVIKQRDFHGVSKKRLVLVIILNLINIFFIVYGAVFQPGISSFLLGIFIANLLTYAVYYIVMKVYHKERITWTTVIYIVLGVICWIPALYFFVSIKASSDLSPAESRNLNGECIVLDLFDNHDLWHMFSAAGLFFCFMMLMSLDDGLFYTPRDQIHIF